MSGPQSTAPLLRIALGFAIWSVGFAAIYAVNALGCAFGWPPDIQRLFLLALAVLHIAALAALALWARGQVKDAGDPASARSGLLVVGAGTAAATAFAALVGFLPPLLLTMCQ